MRTCCEGTNKISLHLNYSIYKMKAIILKEAGEVKNLIHTEISKPKVKNDEVLVKVKSISINPVDVNARAYEGVLSWIFGDKQPVILGWDISGEITEKGDKVTSFKLGEEVFGMVNFFVTERLTQNILLFQQIN